LLFLGHLYSCDYCSISPLAASVADKDINPPYLQVISDLKGLGLQAEDFKIYEFDLMDALVVGSVSYEFESNFFIHILFFLSRTIFFPLFPLIK